MCALAEDVLCVHVCVLAEDMLCVLAEDMLCGHVAWQSNSDEGVVTHFNFEEMAS